MLILAGLAWSWRRLPDVIIDFGRELYVPWRIVEGEVLYRDIASFNGPLSFYWLALWYRCFGVSLHTLVFANLLVVAATTWLLYRLLTFVAGQGTAFLSCVTFLGLFAFAHFLPTGNYNWLCPYSHELPHGAFLSFAAIYFWCQYAVRGDRRWLGAAGFTLGLIFLTKAEVFLAALAAHVTAIASLRRLEGRRSGLLALSVGTALAAPGVTWLILARAMPAADALQGTCGSWPYVFQSNLRDLFYFKWNAGLLDPRSSILSILISATGYVAVLLPAFALALAANRWPRIAWNATAKKILMLLIFLCYGCALSVLWLRLQWIDMTRAAQPLPLLLLLILGPLVSSVLRGNVAADQRRIATVRLIIVVFSLSLLGRMILNVRLAHYGFVLCMPATLVVLAALWDWIPNWIRSRNGEPGIFRAAVLAGWSVILAGHMMISQHYLSEKTHLVNRGADSLRADATRGKLLSDVTDYLDQHALVGDTLAVLPEGVILNYWLRLPSTTPFVEYHPPALLMYGEERMLRSLQQKPPDWIVLVHRDHWEYGASFLGKDYGLALANWIERRYAADALFGAPPFRSNEFGILVVKKRLEQRK